MRWTECEYPKEATYLEAYYVDDPDRRIQRGSFLGWVMRLKAEPNVWYVMLQENYPTGRVGPFDTLEAAKVAYILMEANL